MLHVEKEISFVIKFDPPKDLQNNESITLYFEIERKGIEAIETCMWTEIADNRTKHRFTPRRPPRAAKWLRRTAVANNETIKYKFTPPGTVKYFNLVRRMSVSDLNNLEMKFRLIHTPVSQSWKKWLHDKRDHHRLDRLQK